MDLKIPPLLFPIVLIALDFAASAVYFNVLDWRKAIYWLAAGVLTICVTF